MKIGNKEKGAIFPTHRNVTLDPFLIYSVTLYEHFFRFSPSFLTSPKRTFFFLSTPSSFCSHSHLVISFSMSVVIKSVDTKKVEPKGSLGHHHPPPCFCLVLVPTCLHSKFLVPLWPKYESKWWLSEYLCRSYLTFDMERQKYSTKYLPLNGRSNLSSKIINSQEKTFFHYKMVYEKNVHKILSHKALSKFEARKIWISIKVTSIF